MAIEHPFLALFETFGRLPAVHAESVNRAAYERLWDVLAVGLDQPGRCVLLRAPRAGHGKTHLLSRLQHHLGAGHEFIPLHAAHGSHIDAATVTGDALTHLARALPASGGLTVLDLLIRKLFALALQPLVRSGEVPCQDREGALAALRNRPVETFDFHHPNAVTAHWAKENFEVLGARLALELSQRSGAPLREVMFWVDSLFRFAATPAEHPSRPAVLAEAVTATDLPAAQVFDRLATFLDLMSQLVRVVLVADDLEGFSADETAALRLASFLGSLRHSAGKVDAIISVNRDIWDSAFLPRLSDGLADRLAEIVVELEPLNREDIVALLDARAPGLGERVFQRLDQSGGNTHARGILRAAGDAWVLAAKQNQQGGYPAHPVSAPVKVSEEVPETAPDPVPVVSANVPASNPVETPPPAAVSHPTHPETVHPSAAIAAAVAAAELDADAEESAEVPEAPPVAAAPAPVAPAEEAPLVVWPSPTAAVEERPAIVWNVPAASVPDTSPAPQTMVPVPPEVSEAVARIPEAVPMPEPSTTPQASFQETPLAEVLAGEAAAETSPAAGLFGASFQPAVAPHSTPEPDELWDTPVVPVAAAIDNDSPFQARKPEPMESPVPPAPAIQHPAVPPNAYGAPSPAPVLPAPPSSPVTQAAPAPATPQETDRVDELLRQFRERYAKG